jgi:hypothetical protein
LEEAFSSSSPDAYVYVLAGAFAFLLFSFFIFDWFVRTRNRKLVLSAAKSGELIVSTLQK